MPTRTTASAVKDIMDTELTDTRIDAFITSASDLVDRLLADDYEDPTLEQLELWLTAHLIASTIERQAIQEIAGPVEQKFSDVFGQNLSSTTYGQVVASLDTSGKLANLGKRKIIFKAVKGG